MGAFDGLKLYQAKASAHAIKEELKSLGTTPPEGYYISWRGTRGGLRGKWFESRKQAVRRYMAKLNKGLHPAAWFPAPELEKVKK